MDGLLGLASLLPPARYGTPHVAPLIGRRWVFVNPFTQGWFLTALRSVRDGRPATTSFTSTTASVSGAEIVVTSPMIDDIIKANEGECATQELRQAGLGWSISVVTVGDLLLRPSYRLANVLFIVLLLAMPIVVSSIRGDYSGVGSLLYVVFGLTVRFIESVAYVSVPQRQARPNNPMGLLHFDPLTTTIVVLRGNPNHLVNIEDLAHPHLQTRSVQFATLCRRAYRLCTGVCLVVWLGLLVASSRSQTKYTDGYVELATLVLSGLGDLVMTRFVSSTVRVRTVRKRNAITAMAWLASRYAVDAPGVPPHLLALRDNERNLIHALFRRQQNANQNVDDELWDRVPRCNREQVESEQDGPPIIQ